MEEGEKVTCNVHETGVCALHAREVELRDKNQKAIEEAVSKIADKLPGMSRATYALIMVASLVGVVIAGSFIYTRDIGQQAIQRDTEIVAQQRVISNQLQDIAVNSARNEGLQSALLKEMREFTQAVMKNDQGKPRR